MEPNHQESTWQATLFVLAMVAGGIGLLYVILFML